MPTRSGSHELANAGFVENRHRIIQRCRKPGPYVYGVYRDRLEKLWPKN